MAAPRVCCVVLGMGINNKLNNPFGLKRVSPMQLVEAVYGVTVWIAIEFRDDVHLAVNQNPVLSRAPPTPGYIPLCRGLLLRTFVANAWRWYALQKNLVAKVLVASRGISVTNLCRGMAAEACYKPSVLTHSHFKSQEVLSSLTQHLFHPSSAENDGALNVSA